jgi:hypothetical protein
VSRLESEIFDIPSAVLKASHSPSGEKKGPVDATQVEPAVFRVLGHECDRRSVAGDREDRSDTRGQERAFRNPNAEAVRSGGNRFGTSEPMAEAGREDGDREHHAREEPRRRSAAIRRRRCSRCRRAGRRRDRPLRQLLEGQAHIADAAQALAGVLAQAASKQRHDALGHLALQHFPVRLGANDRGEDVGQRVAAERRGAGEQLVQHAAEGPHVGALIDDLTARLLR